MSGDYSGCEIVELGIQIEMNGRDFYKELAASAENKKAAEAFRYLAGEEEKHIGIFKKIFASSCEHSPEGAYPDEYFAYMNALARQYVFTQKDKGSRIARDVRGYLEGMDLGIKFEKDSILFYEGLLRIVPEKDRPLVEGLINEEKGHLKRLLDLRKECSDEECKGV